MLLNRDWLDKGLEFMGLSEIASNKGNKEKNSEVFTYPSFTTLLSYQYFDGKDGLFHNDGDNYGLIYKIIPFTGANESLAEEIDGLLREKISDDFTLHCLYVNTNKVGEQIDDWENQFSNGGISGLEELGENLSNFYRDAAINGFKTNKNIKPRLTNTECYFIIDKKIPGGSKEAGPIFSRFKSSFEAGMHAMNMGFVQQGVEGLADIMSLFLSNDPDDIYKNQNNYKSNKLLNEQVVRNEFYLKVNPDHLLIENTNSKNKRFTSEVTVLSLDELPESYAMWNNIDNSSNITSPEQSLSCNHIISVTYEVAEAVKAQRKAVRRANDYEKKANSDYGRQIANTGKLAQEWKNYKEHLGSSQTRSLKMFYNVILFSREGERVVDVEKAKNAFRYTGIKLGICTHMQLNYFIASFPFMFTGKMDSFFHLPTLGEEISSWNAIQYTPILSDWSGVGNGIMVPTCRGQFSCIDQFSSYLGTNYNLALSGQTGSGKSFFINLLLLNVLLGKGDVFIVDVGGSYTKLAKVLGGVSLEYENLALNPFTFVKDIYSDIDEIVSLFELLAKPRGNATDDDVGTLRAGIIAAFEKSKNDTLIDDVQKAILELHEKDSKTYPTGIILAKNLTRYCQNEEHGKIFNEPSSFSPNARFIVVDLKGVKDKKEIRSAVLLSVISQYKRRMFDSDRSRKKMCIIDEAWSFLKGDPIASEFIANGFRTGRKHNVSFVTITQGIDDYYEFPDARAPWDCSANKIIFMQDVPSLTKHQEEYKTFSDYEFGLIKKFPKAKDAGYSQFLIKGSELSSFHRVFVDPITQVLFSSDGRDFQYVENLMAKGFPIYDAVKMVAKQLYGAK